MNKFLTFFLAGAITGSERQDIKQIRKGALSIVFGDQYENCRKTVELTCQDSLDAMREKLCLKFDRKAERNDKFQIQTKNC